MKKLVLCTITLLLVLSTFGCSKKDLNIDAEQITSDTLVAKSNGQLQVATVEEFDKDYYQLSELEEFVSEEIKVYNQKAGGDKIAIEDLQLKNNKAVMVLTYSGMDQYAAFNEVTAAYFNGGVTNIPLSLPDKLKDAKNDSFINTNEALQNTKYKVLIINEPYDIIVDGKIKYYSENAVMVENNKIQSAADDMTIIVFKP
jgi:hypothetical protein